MVKAKGRNGSGTLRQRGERWEYRVSVDGRQRSFYGASRAEALAGPTRATEAARRATVAAADVTLSAFAARWLESRKTTVRTSTARHNASAIARRILPVLGDRKLRTLTVADVQAFHAACAADCAPGTVRVTHMILRAMLDAAVAEGILDRNPAAIAKAPRTHVRAQSTLTATQGRVLLDASRGDRFEAVYYLALTTAARSGEILALTWGDIDFEARTVHYHGTVTDAVGGGLTVGPPKTTAGNRVVDLTDGCLAGLRRQRDTVNARPDALLFPYNGRLMSTTYFLMHEFYPMLSRAGLPRVRMHDLRHTACTLMIEDGVSASVVQRIAGHANVAVTLGLYVNVTPRMHDEATASMQRRFA